MRQSHDVVIVGSGHAGAQAAIMLRQLNFKGSIAIVSAERDPPYERPPLSKDYLAGALPFERLLLRKPDFWAERGIDFIGGEPVQVIDSHSHELVCASGLRIGYGKLIWTAGGSPRPLVCPGAERVGVHYVRSRGDVDGVRADLVKARRIAIVGGGYIGLEVAAVLAERGKTISLIEAESRLLARVSGAELSAFYERIHRARGVDIRTGAVVAAIEGDADGVTAVRLADGTRLAAELVIAGIGILPNTAPLIEAGAAGADGVDVDEFGQTSLADIFAAGDCAAHENRYAGGARVRIESVQNANDQAAAAARCIAGRPVPYEAVPWFWSNQYNLRLQTVGLALGFDRTVLRGDPGSESFSVIYLKNDRVIALDCVNATKDYVQGRKLVEHGVSVPAARLADTSMPLKEMLG